MKTFKFSFRGRQSGAIGIFYQITDTYKANSIKEAVSMLYTDYEHIQSLKLNDKYFKVEDSHFINLPDYKVKQDRK
jgi:hypothetical protein